MLGPKPGKLRRNRQGSRHTEGKGTPSHAYRLSAERIAALRFPGAKSHRRKERPLTVNLVMRPPKTRQHDHHRMGSMLPNRRTGCGNTISYAPHRSRRRPSCHGPSGGRPGLDCDLSLSGAAMLQTARIAPNCCSSHNNRAHTVPNPGAGRYMSRGATFCTPNLHHGNSHGGGV